MSFERIHEQLAVSPFVPLSVHLTDGRFFHVDHVDFATLIRSSRTLAIHSESGRIAYLDIDQIVSIETIELETQA